MRIPCLRCGGRHNKKGFASVSRRCKRRIAVKVDHAPELVEYRKRLSDKRFTRIGGTR